MTATIRLAVNLPAAPARSYDILVGANLLKEAGAMITDRLGRRRCLIVSDETVAHLYLQPLLENLRAAGHDCLAPALIPPGEASKNVMTFAAIAEHALSQHPDRRLLVVALGGGVIGDMAGFLAAVLLRGVEYVQIPTTLLAQVDSSVGGKTGIDSAYGKNLIGAFYQPRLVLADIGTLKSLPVRQLRAGFAEVIKYGLIDRPDFFDWCEKYAKNLLKGDAALLQEAVAQSIRAKAEVVDADEKESGVRALLNLGHTFGHALESLAGFTDKLFHGEAVAIGCALALRFSVEEGLCPAADLARYEKLCAACDLPIKPPAQAKDISQLIRYMASDKKNRDGKITLILSKGIGKAFIAPGIEAEKIEKFWQKVLK